MIRTRTVDVEITNPDGSVVFEKKDFEVPEEWSDRAAKIVASKYAMDNEFSAVDIIDRVVNQITDWGVEQGYFSSEDDGDNEETHRFFDSLKDILINQRAAFNSPVWFNCGVKENSDQMSACFIFTVDDNMQDILEHVKREGTVFKSGSGAGINISKLRAKGEKLSNKGEASGPLSFMKVYDANAGSIKSGGKSRRSAKMVCLDVNHPDIMEFIHCKKNEELKAKALMAAGYPQEEAYATVAFQNANHSIRVTDAFMDAACNDRMWDLINRGNGKVAKTVRAKDILHQTAEIAWETGDPGIQFDTAMNKTNPIPEHGRINSTNPCQPGFATVLTKFGIKTFDEIDVGSVIWTGKSWSKVTHKIPTGTKPVNEYITTAGTFVGTEEHRVFQNKERIQVGQADAIDICRGETLTPSDEMLNTQDIVDGWVFGDGSIHKASNNLVYLNLGQDDIEVFMSLYKDYYERDRTKLSPFAHKVDTTIEAGDIALTYKREIPHRFLTATPDQMRGFLKGLYNANGSVCGKRVTLKATSFNVISDVQKMLSSIGIRSYFTTNKKKKVQFENGLYECKESYDLNITRDKDVFARLIGFDHPNKQEKLQEALDSKKSYKPPKETYEIIRINELGDMPVWDIRVEAEEHSYWTGGLLVSNCSEFSAIDNSSCNLSSLNLMKYRIGTKESFDWDQFYDDIDILITAMDIIVDAAEYPTPEVRDITTRSRPLGLGFTNLGALLMSWGVPYDSDEAREFAKRLTLRMTTRAYQQSVELSKKLGPFEMYKENKEHVLNVAYQIIGSEYHESPVINDIVEHGIRNSQLTLLAPTGTISFMMDCDTTGIEPMFALKAYKQLAGGGFLEIVPDCLNLAADALAAEGFDVGIDIYEGIKNLPEDKRKVFETANEISWKAHIDMMAVCQKHINGAISKTVNMPADCSVADIEDAYVYAWEKGLKALAIYRDGSKGMQPLTDANKKKEEEKPQESWHAIRRRLPDDRSAKNHKFDIAGFEGYINAGHYDDGQLGEIFITGSKIGSQMKGLLESFSIATSMALQYGVPLEALADKFINTKFDPAGFTKNADIRMCSSIMDYLFKWLMQNFGTEIPEPEVKLEGNLSFDGPSCNNCGGITTKQGTCFVCPNCGETTGCS